ncbi:MAG: hypothetical protein LBJ72_12850 [Dysgonamonadaceae bacterium]|jgi:hypothetical protein|nr:hypothetical protein [Dysgonamonadaceae bacterium]
MAKLKDDHIRWILDLDAKGIQGELQKLSSVTTKLENDNKRLNVTMAEAQAQIRDTEKEMRKLEKAGKEASPRYQELKNILASAQDEVSTYTTKIRENSKAIETNNEAIGIAIKAMKLEDMTMNQLKNRAVSLKKQLDNTSKAADPEQYDKLEKELTAVRKQMGALDDKSKSLCDTFNTMKGVLWATIVTKVGEKVAEWTKAIIDFTKESIKMAAAAQGVEAAFNRIATKSDLSSLRKDTKGLVNDFELMKAAVKAENFNIPLGQLGRLLQFAQQRAKDTGESVDYLVNSIVNGIGRKSPLILDNLGISAAKLNEEVKKTGDFAGAVAKIVEEEMSKVGKSMDTVAESSTRKAVALENLQLALGKRFLGMQEVWNKMTTGLINSLSDLVEVEKSHTEQYNDQIKFVADLNVNVTKLVDRYEELAGKANLNKTEQAELETIVTSLTDKIPGLVAETDKYGRALKLNTGYIREYLQAEQMRLQYLHKDEISKTQDDITYYEKRLELAQKYKKQGEIERESMRKNMGEERYLLMISTKEYQERLAARTDADSNRINEWSTKLQGAQAHLKKINGEELKNLLDHEEAILEKRNEFNDMTQKQLDEYIKINKASNDEYIELAQEVYHFRFGNSGGGSGDDKNKEELNKLKKLADEQKKILTDTTIQIEIATKTYNDKLKEAELFGIELNKLTQEQLDARLKIDQDYQDKLTEITLKGEQERFNKAKKDAGVDGDATKFTDQQNKVLELLQQQHEANIQKIKDASGKTQKEIQDSINSVILSSLQQSQKSQLDVISATEKGKIIFLQSEVSSGLKTRMQYENELKKFESDSLASRIVTQEDYINKLKQLTTPSEEQKKELKDAEQVLQDLTIQSNNVTTQFSFQKK